jgi:hypothetical protein
MDSALNQLRGPGLHNWEMTALKNIQFAGERGPRLQLRLEAFNVFNHAQWATVNSTAIFNNNTPTAQITNKPTQLGGTGGRLGFGALNGIRANSQRILQVALKLSF